MGSIQTMRPTKMELLFGMKTRMMITLNSWVRSGQIRMRREGFRISREGLFGSRPYSQLMGQSWRRASRASGCLRSRRGSTIPPTFGFASKFPIPSGIRTVPSRRIVRFLSREDVVGIPYRAEPLVPYAFWKIRGSAVRTRTSS